jgi:antitoxin VapB
MALSIKNKELEEVVRKLARATGKPMTEALLEGAKRELRRQEGIRKLLPRENVLQDVREIQRRYAARPVPIEMTEDEILGYDDIGAPTR